MENLHYSYTVSSAGTGGFLVNEYNFDGDYGTIYKLNIYSNNNGDVESSRRVPSNFESAPFATLRATNVMYEPENNGATSNYRYILVEVDTNPFTYAWITTMGSIEFTTDHRILMLCSDTAGEPWAVDTEDNYYLMYRRIIVYKSQFRSVERSGGPINYYVCNSGIVGIFNTNSLLFEFEDIVSYEDRQHCPFLYCGEYVPHSMGYIYCCKITKRSGETYKLTTDDFKLLMQRARAHIGIGLFEYKKIENFGRIGAQDEV